MPTNTSGQGGTVSVDTAFQLISDRLADVSQKIQKIESQKEEPEKKPTSWWTIVTGILGIPAVLVLMYLQFSQASGNIETRVKTAAETEKIKTEELKTRVELQRILDDLAQEKAAGLEAYEERLKEVLPKIESTFQRLRELSTAKPPFEGWSLLAKYLLIWATFMALGLFSRSSKEFGPFWSIAF